MKQNEVHYEDWSIGPFRCYKIEPINSTSPKFAKFDIVQIENFGRYFFNNDGYICKTSENLSHIYSLNNALQ